jgi:pimeloyl-ACP methyl ester carboxylesterase
MELQKIVANGIELHYVEQGQGVPLVLVHGGLADWRDWRPHLARFAEHYRVIAYSRRYNYPNHNREIRPDHSALVEAADLAALLDALGLDRSHIAGHSYGAFTALCLALTRPERIRALVLSEPPLHRWLAGTPAGEAVFSDFIQSFWQPLGQAFRNGDPALALEITANFFIGPDSFTRLPAALRQRWQDNLPEWEALATSQDAYPAIPRERVAQIRLPTLLLTAAQTITIHRLVNAELEQVLSSARRETLPNATHGLWAEQPEQCSTLALDFLRSVHELVD